MKHKLLTPEEDRQWWDELTALQQKGNTRAFFAKYSQYLERCGIVSHRRWVLYQMSLNVAAQNKHG